MKDQKQEITKFAIRIRWLARVFISAFDRFYTDGGFRRSAALAYTTLLSLVPVTALFFGVLASFAVSEKFIPEVRDYIFRQWIPDADFVDKVLEYLSNYSSIISSLDALVIVVFAITAIVLISTIEKSLNEIWQVYEVRTFTQRLLIFCAVVVITPILAISVYYFTTVRVDLFVSKMLHSDALTSYISYLVPYFFDSLAFFALYLLVPYAPVKIRSAVFGALVAALLFGAAKGGFALYVEKFPTYDKVYGALAAVPLLLVWVYFAWCIVLFGAECAYQWQHLPYTGKLWKRTLLTVGDSKLILAIQALVAIGTAYDKGERPPNELELCEELGCSSVILKPIISQLEKASFITRSDTKDQSLTLLMSPVKILVTDIKSVICDARDLSYPTSLKKFFDKINNKSTSLKELI